MWRERALKECTSHGKNGEKDEKKSEREGGEKREDRGCVCSFPCFPSLERLVVYDRGENGRGRVSSRRNTFHEISSREKFTGRNVRSTIA